MAALAEAKALPADFSTVMDEEAGNGSFLDTEKDREQRRKIAKEKKLGLFISVMNGIERANVVYDSDTKGGIEQGKNHYGLGRGKAGRVRTTGRG